MLGVGNTVVNKIDKVPTHGGGCAPVNQDRYCTITIKEHSCYCAEEQGAVEHGMGGPRGKKAFKQLTCSRLNQGPKKDITMS